MSFVNFVKEKLEESQKLFGTYNYEDKGADEVMDVGEIVKKLKKLPQKEALSSLKEILALECDLDPSILVRSILGSLDDDPNYEFLFEDEEIAEHY